MVAVLLGLVAGCASGNDRGVARPGATARGAEPAGEQHLVVGEREDPYITEGAAANVGQHPLDANIYEGLVRMTPDYRIKPALATAWEFKPPNTWRFTLRKDVRFHDGEPLTAQAVKYSFDRIAGRGGDTLGLGEDSTRIIDDYTVEITPTFPNHRLVEQLVAPSTSILATGTTPGTKTIGTGPFRFVGYTPKREIVVERNDDYWGRKPQLNRITFRFLPDPDARVRALEAGDVDVSIDVPPDAITELGAKGFLTKPSEVGAAEAMYANVKGDGAYAITRDRAVRTAIQYAIDREQLVDGVFAGLAESEQTWVPSRLLGNNARVVKPYDYDPSKAKATLDLAGWKEGPRGVRQKNGQPLRLQLIYGFPDPEVHSAVPQLIQGQLQTVGIAVDLVKTPDAAAYEQRLNAGNGHLWLEQRSQDNADPAFLPARLFWTKGLLGRTGYQAMFPPGGRFDDLITKALSTPDSEEARRFIAEAMYVLIDQEAVVIPLAGVTRITVLTDQVQGFEPHPSLGQVRYDEVRLNG